MIVKIKQNPTVNKDATASVSPSSSQTGRSFTTKTTDQRTHRQSQQLRCPYSLRSRRQEDEQTGHTQKDARDELNQGKK